MCLKSTLGIADSLYNLRILRNFCERHLPNKTWHFTLEDLLYTNKSLQENIVMMIAELFYWFEIKTQPFVTGAGLKPEEKGNNKLMDFEIRIFHGVEFFSYVCI